MKLKARTFTDDEITGLIPAQAIIDFDRAKEVLEKVAQSQCSADQQALDQAVKCERERIISYLQDLLELSEKVKEPAIKVKMMDVLTALKKEASG